MDEFAHLKIESSAAGSVQIGSAGGHVTVLQIGQLLASLAESTLQANFFTSTGIRCGPGARAELEALMVKDFDSHALYLAWQRRLLQWHNIEKRLEVEVGWQVALTAFALACFFAVLIGAIWVIRTERLWGDSSGTQLLILLGFLSAICSLALWAVRALVEPVRTAKRVGKVLAERKPTKV